MMAWWSYFWGPERVDYDTARDALHAGYTIESVLWWSIVGRCSFKMGYNYYLGARPAFGPVWRYTAGRYFYKIDSSGWQLSDGWYDGRLGPNQFRRVQ